MKKGLITTASIALTALMAFGTFSIHQHIVNASSEKDEKVEQVKNLITELDKTSLTYEDEIYVKSIKTLYNSLTDEQKSSISNDLVNKLDECIVYTCDLVSAKSFSENMDYLINNPTFASEYVLAKQEAEYSKLSTQAQGFVQNFTDNEKAKIRENAQSLTPDIFYDFRNPNISNTTIVNQGKVSDKNATLMGEANVQEGYLSLGGQSSYVKLPEQLFTSGHDFTFSIEYERTNDTNNVSLFSFGTEAYTCGGENTNAGLRAAIHTEYDRGPTNYMKLATTNNEQLYTGIVHADSDNKNHLIRMTIRYISEASCVQVCTVDTVTDYYMYVNQGCSYPSYNQYTKVNAINMPFSDFNFNILGAYNGDATYPGGHVTSFNGKIYSFRFYNELVSEYQMFGIDNRSKNIGCGEIIDFVNNFEVPSNKDVLIRYLDEYKKVFDRTHDDVLSIPYDFRFLYNQEKLQTYLATYEFIENL